MHQRIVWSVVWLASVATAFAGPVVADEFRPVSEAARTYESVPGYPEAPAVVLFRNAHFTMMGALGSEAFSSLEVEGRLKLLTEEGTEFGEVEVAHSDFVRLVSFVGRTVLPDGTTVPLPEDALFEQTVSGRKRWSVTTATFPALEPGAIIDYRYVLRFESFNSFDPWYFQAEIPTEHSEIVYTVPSNVAAIPWGKATFGRQLQSERQRSARGMRLRVWMDDLPPVPDEPLTLPFEDLSSSFLLLPSLMEVSGQRVLLFQDWRSACDLLDYFYSEMRHGIGQTRRQAKQLAKAAGKDPEARARAVYAFVRDEIGTLDLPGVIPHLGEGLDEMLRARRADIAGKGIMLREMLEAAGLDADLVWAADRSFGVVDTSIANPNWFERVLVRVELDGREVFLDASEPGAGFGYLVPALEGMPALVYHTRKPEVIEIPTRPFEENRRHAAVELRVDESGALRGTGSLVLSGHHAADWLLGTGTSEGLRDALDEFLAGRFSGFSVSDLAVEEERDTSRIEVTWRMEQAGGEVLGDQATVVPSRPLGPISQRFTLAPVQRRSPVLLAFADRDELELTVRWPEGWLVEVVPEAVSFDNGAGGFETSVTLDEEERTLRYTRRFDTVERSFVGSDAYTALRNLYGRVEAGDQQTLVLVRQ